MSKDLSRRAREIIEHIEYVTIASVDEKGLPWNAPVFAAYDQDYNFYWGTHRNSQKAKNIRGNSNVFMVVYDSTVPSGRGEGVYIRANAQEITDPYEAKRILELIKSRHATDYWQPAAIEGDGPIRLYKAVPEKVWMNDEGHKNGHYIDIRTHIEL